MKKIQQAIKGAVKSTNIYKLYLRKRVKRGKRGQRGKGKKGEREKSKSLVLKYNAKPILCYSSQCYHCLFTPPCLTQLSFLKITPTKCLTQICCVFCPANGCIACHLLVEIIFFSILNFFPTKTKKQAKRDKIFSYFSICDGKKMWKCWKTCFWPANYMQSTSSLGKIHNTNPPFSWMLRQNCTYYWCRQSIGLNVTFHALLVTMGNCIDQK